MVSLTLAIPALNHAPRALLVDRDADTRQLYAEFLRRIACEIDEAEDGRDALAKALTGHPDVIVTETRLPGISGLELCRVLRHDPETSRIPIVLVTGDGFPRDVKLAEAAGASAVLVKPCLPEQLADAIREVLEWSVELRARSVAARRRSAAHIARSTELLQSGRVRPLSRAFERRETTTPPLAPPQIACPVCAESLRYLTSHIGGVSARHEEQWDDYQCPAGCGRFQYRQRTRKLRRAI